MTASPDQLSAAVSRAGAGRTWVQPEPEQEADGSAGQLPHGEQRIQHPEGSLVDRARHIPRAANLHHISG